MWQETNNGLHKQFEFPDFKQAFAFMTQVAGIAEVLQHHPRWHNTYNRVEIWLSTHEADGAITDKDRDMAARIDQLGEPAVKAAEGPRVKKVKMYGDGGSRGNPGPSASGYVLLDENDQVLLEKGVYLGITTNNQAEYRSLKFGLEEARKMGAREVDVYMDSLLVINQMKGVFKVRNRDLWPVYEEIKQYLPNFAKVTFTHVPRELNKLADHMVNVTLDNETA